MSPWEYNYNITMVYGIIVVSIVLQIVQCQVTMLFLLSRLRRSGHVKSNGVNEAYHNRHTLLSITCIYTQHIVCSMVCISQVVYK